MFFIYDHPAWQMAIVFSLAFAAISVIGLLLFRASLHRWLHRDDKVNEMVGFAMASFSMLYGLLLGMLAVAAYENYVDIQTLTDRESIVLGTLYDASGALPDPHGADLEKILRAYARNVIEVSWPQQQNGEVPTAETALITAYTDRLHLFEPQTPREEAVQIEAIELANELVQTRRTRLLSVDGGIPHILWWVVLAGAFINILLVWMLDMARHTHIILAAIVGGFLGLVIFLIAALDYPFRGDVSVTSGPFEFVYATTMALPPATR